MAKKSAYRIIRKESEVNDAVIESVGLTIGRLPGNDLVLNHPLVSRTHAGIKPVPSLEITEEESKDSEKFFLYNLSRSNTTLINGVRIGRAPRPLSNGDRIQIGPYHLTAEYKKQELSITVELGVREHPVETDGVMELERGFISEYDREALEIFWESRKREAGKIIEKSRLHPDYDEVAGKSRFNWHPTLDLKEWWRSSYFTWGAIAAAVFSLLALFALSLTYSPGEISDPHAASFDRNSLLARNMANEQSAASCSKCHSVAEGMGDKCINCHTTAKTESKPPFLPATLIIGHQREGLACADCHIEHEGASKESGLVSYAVCYQCHNGKYEIKTGERAGMLLPLPHGGETGYAKVTDEGRGGEYWNGLTVEKWKKKIARWKRINPQLITDPEDIAEESSSDQFHRLHLDGIGVEGFQDKQICGICHSDDTGRSDTPEWIQLSPRQACAKCHTVSFRSEGMVRESANCRTCHQQHGANEDILNTARMVAESGKEAEFITSLNKTVSGTDRPVRVAGGASIQRQNSDELTTGNISEGFGGLPLNVWALIIAIPALGALVFVACDAMRRRFALRTTPEALKLYKKEERRLARLNLIAKFRAEGRSENLIAKVETGPLYPHPVIDSDQCIGCYACMEACPHDVITMVKKEIGPPGKGGYVEVADTKAVDQCMEDTACQVVCPTSPLACIIVNATKPIPSKQAPVRKEDFQTDAEGIYLIGDVSGSPLIKNAINEGGKVIDCIAQVIKGEGRNPNAEYDIAIIGMGPAGLSAAVMARKRELSYVAIEQDKIAATIEKLYFEGKYIYFKPFGKPATGGLRVPVNPDGEPLPGEIKESVLKLWMEDLSKEGVVVRERVRCTKIEREDGVFRVVTVNEDTKADAEYKVRKVVLAIGNHGTPRKLGVLNEDWEMQTLNECRKCRTPGRKGEPVCRECGEPLYREIFNVRIRNRLTAPEDYVGKKCVVVGAGNSAVEAAVALCGFRQKEGVKKFVPGSDVTIIIRSKLKGDLKLGNKMNFYECWDADKIKVISGRVIEEIIKEGIVLSGAKTEKKTMLIPADYVFTFIGGEPPTPFLESMGIKITGE